MKMRFMQTGLERDLWAGRKQFFFEKKNQKTFACYGARRSGGPRQPTE
jgi:hypothetical protein